MPTISTLDVKDAGPINNPNFGYNVRNEIPFSSLPNRVKYAFDAYFAAGGVNEPHVQITNGQGSAYSYPYNTSYFTDNSAWIQSELQESAHRMPATLTTVYNYGNAYRHLLPSVQISQGGQRYINKENVPVNGGTSATQAAPAAGSFDVYTPGCNAAVRVNAGGQLTVGGDNSHLATLQVSRNSILAIEAGGQVTMSTGSILHVVAGGTLVMHQGSTLQGYVEIDAGAYLCTESGTTVGSSNSAISNAAIYGINPQLLASGDLTYLNLGAVACSQPSFQVHITSYGATSQCVSRSGRDNYAQWTATAQSGTGPYAYAWYIDPTASGNNYQPAPYGSTVASAGNTSTLGLCMNGYSSSYIMAKVVVTNSTGQQATDSFYGMPQMFLYPNPADSYADLTADDNPDGASAARSTAAAGSAPPLAVTVYNGQGSVVFTATDVRTGSVHLPTSTWPNGLYQVRTQQGKMVKTQQLSVQH